MAFWMDGFQRDMNIESEVRYWEHLSSCFLEIIVDSEMFKLYKRERENFYEDLFQLLFLINNSDFSQENFLENFDSEFIEKASAIFSHNIPIYDFDEELPFKETIENLSDEAYGEEPASASKSING